jgi:Ni/Co efflux regulator RcnB
MIVLLTMSLRLILNENYMKKILLSVVLLVTMAGAAMAQTHKPAHKRHHRHVVHHHHKAVHHKQ